jgi:hypothetical protein
MSSPEKVVTTDVPELTKVEERLEDKPTFPEGGLQAWLTVAGA